MGNLTRILLRLDLGSYPPSLGKVILIAGQETDAFSFEVFKLGSENGQIRLDSVGLRGPSQPEP